MAIRWIQDGEPHAAEVYNRPLRDFVLETGENIVLKTTKVNVSNGLSGGGELSGDIDVVGVDATATRKGVTRFATLAEAIGGTVQNVAIDPNVLRNALPQRGLGEGQTWRNMTGSRSIGVTYTNTTGRAIAVAFSGYNANSGGKDFSLSISGVSVGTWYGGPIQSVGAQVFGIVPAGGTYSIHYGGGTGDITAARWVELR